MHTMYKATNYILFASTNPFSAPYYTHNFSVSLVNPPVVSRGEILPVRLKKWFFNALKKRQKRIVQICGITV